MANEIKPIVLTDISAMGAVVGNLMTDLRQIRAYHDVLAYWRANQPCCTWK